MAFTAEQANAWNARLNTAGDRLLDIEGLLRESGRLESVDGHMLSILGDVLELLGEIVNEPTTT